MFSETAQEHLGFGIELLKLEKGRLSTPISGTPG
jgi:hypothetical protein